MKMDTRIKMVLSGFPFIDDNWGGLYNGGSYMLVGPRKSGKTLLSLKLAKECVQSGEKCLYFTTMRPRDLMIHSASINLDIQQYMNNNQIIVVRVSSPNEILNSSDPDSFLVDYLNDIVTIVKQYNPNRIYFDEITPYIGFKSLNMLREIFVNILEIIEEKGITSLFVVGEPATVKAQSIFKLISENMTGLIELSKKESKVLSGKPIGSIKISPNVGHTEGIFESEYSFKPDLGIVTKFDPDKSIESYHKEVKTQKKAISEILTFTNIYSYDDFSLILNNQIALYKSTNQMLTVLQLEPTSKNISTEDLIENVKKICNKPEKICISGNKILILLMNSNSETTLNFINKLKISLKNEYQEEYEFLSQNFSLNILEVNDSITDSESLISSLNNISITNPNKFSTFS